MRGRWGLIPSWWKETAKEVPSTFNAQAETVAEKPMFLSAFKRMRCIVPASGYYEWQTIGKAKLPYFISAADGTVLSIAGLGSMERPGDRRDDCERHIDRDWRQ
jgi:putative SOS response-associated peptidase YedK